MFHGRYKAVLVERESRVPELCRYVVLNPVRAGIGSAFVPVVHQVTSGDMCKKIYRHLSFPSMKCIL